MKHTVLCYALFLSGCATIVNTAWQEVPFVLPDNTVIKDTLGTTYSPKKITNSLYSLQLARRNDYTFEFHNNGKVLRKELNKYLEGGYIVADIFLNFFPLLIDAATGAWYSFEGVRVSFPDSVNGFREPIASSIVIDELPSGYVLGFDTRLGVTVVFGVGLGLNGVFSNNRGPAAIYAGVGYRATDGLAIYGMYNGGFNNGIGKLHDSLNVTATFNEGSLELRFFPEKYSGWYFLTGTGYSRIRTGHLYRDNPNGGRLNFFAPKYHSAIIVHTAAGYAGSIGYVELRTRTAVTPIILPNQQSVRLFDLIFNFGFHLVF